LREEIKGAKMEKAFGVVLAFFLVFLIVYVMTYFVDQAFEPPPIY
jgi:hypothetical protein